MSEGTPSSVSRRSFRVNVAAGNQSARQTVTLPIVIMVELVRKTTGMSCRKLLISHSFIFLKDENYLK